MYFNFLPPYTHSGRLERLIGPRAEYISQAMRGGGAHGTPRWYGPPIAMAGVEGNVWAHADGEFRGPIRSGQFTNIMDLVIERVRRSMRTWTREQMNTLHMAGFLSLDDLVAKASTGNLQPMSFSKAGGTRVAAGCQSYWTGTGSPGAGGIGSAAVGRQCLGLGSGSATTGAFLGFNAVTAGQTVHLINAFYQAATIGSTLLYDRLWDTLKTASNSAQETVTAPLNPSRYQTTTPGAMDFVGGNFLFMEAITALGAFAHNWGDGATTGVTYANQAGTTPVALPAIAGVTAGALKGNLDMPLTYWFAPLATGDYGVQALVKMKCSVATITGSAGFVIGHPIAWLNTPAALQGYILDGLNTAFNLVRIFDNACLNLIDVTAQSAAAPAINGTLMTCAG